jgi:hypothetical protein
MAIVLISLLVALGFVFVWLYLSARRRAAQPAPPERKITKLVLSLSADSTAMLRECAQKANLTESELARRSLLVGMAIIAVEWDGGEAVAIEADGRQWPIVMSRGLDKQAGDEWDEIDLAKL